MKHIILSAILAISAGVASAGTIVIKNESWYAAPTFVRYASSEGIQETVCSCAGFDRSYSFGDEVGVISIEPLADLRRDKHITINPDDHIHVTIHGTWFDRPWYTVKNVAPRYWEKWTPPPKFGGL